MVMGQKSTRVLLFAGKPLATNMVVCCTEKLCGGTNAAPRGLTRSTACRQQSSGKFISPKNEKLLDEQQRGMASQGELGNVGEPRVSLSHSRSGGPGDQRPWRGLGTWTRS